MSEPRQELAIAPFRSVDPEIGRMLWMLQDTRERMKQSLQGLDPNQIDLAPEPYKNSIGSLLYHVAVIETDWLYAEVLEREIPDEVLMLFPEGVRDDSGVLAAPQQRELERHLQVLDQIRALVLESYGAMTLDDFRRPRNLPQYDVTPEWVLHHLMQHEAEHRGHIQSLREIIESRNG